jgi:hypothetical protein
MQNPSYKSPLHVTIYFQFIIQNSPTVRPLITQTVDKGSQNKQKAIRHIIFQRSAHTTHIVNYHLPKNLVLGICELPVSSL